MTKAVVGSLVGDGAAGLFMGQLIGLAFQRDPETTAHIPQRLTAAHECHNSQLLSFVHARSAQEITGDAN